ncbi:MAG: hypothetical protein KTR24_09465 [Saprospiraceae bacterium]|nr:hypothetical protein [Saprospiraceae bacterium]
MDERLSVHVLRFQEEAAVRGLAVDINNLGGQITALDEVAGQCVHHAESGNLLRIDGEYWRLANPVMQEFLVFHELGHCLLDRRHLDTKDSSGVCVSMMHSGLGSCRNAYSETTREQYLDELFNSENTGL